MPLLESTLSENNLIQGCIRNDRRTQELLYRNYCASLLSVSRAYAKNEEDALEILQDSFLKIFQQIQRFEPAKSSLYTWMRTIVIRTAIDFLRKGTKAPQIMEWDEKHDSSIDAEVLQKISAEQILHLLQKLSETSRIVFNLYITEGYTHKEIGQTLNISEGTSKWHLSEARKYLVSSLTSKKIA